MFLTKGIKVNVFMLIVLQDKIDIFAIAINISETTQSLNGFVYPEISFLGIANVSRNMVYAWFPR